MKKFTSKIMAFLMAVVMLLGMMPGAALAANWQPGDLITINVRVYDQSTGSVYSVGTDTVAKGDQYIQSVSYKIPSLSEFTTNDYGRVTKVAGNWYFPSGDSNVGANVQWSSNVSSVTMTYWVTQWKAPSSSGGGSSSSSNESQGGGTRTTWTQTIVYHSNYPGGNDDVLSVTYNCGSWTSIASVTGTLKTYAACGFTVPEGYKLADRYWNTKADGSGTSYGTGIYTYRQSDGTVHLYAQYVPDEIIVPDTSVTVTYMDGDDTYAVKNYDAGDTVAVIDCDVTKDGFEFKGWSTTKGGDVVYEVGDTFVVDDDTVLYAVWEAKEQSVEYELIYDANGGTGAPAKETKSSSTGSSTFTVSSAEPEKEGHKFIGWADSADSTAAAYIGGDTITLTAAAASKTIYAVWQENGDPTPTTYTVTYTDGVDGEEIFEDQVYSGLEAGSETPAFTGTPTREGYEFAGWNPEVAETVTGNATYTAVWKSTDDDDDDEKVSQPAMEKTITNGSSNPVKPGEDVEYELKSNIPDYLGDYINPVDPDEPEIAAFANEIVRGSYELVFHDDMDEALSFNNDVAVTVNGKTLAADLYEVIEDAEDGCTFHVVMDLVKIYEAGGYFTLADIETCPAIVVIYSAKLSEDATAGQYKNTAWVSFEGDQESGKDTEDANVYGVTVFKYDQADNTGLQGAEFKLYLDEECTELAVEDTFVSDEDGYITIDGLAAGTYWLKETKAPENYAKSDKPLKITLSNTLNGNNPINILNVKFANSLIPHTGGTGTTMYTIIGVVIIAAAGILLVITRKKKEVK